MWPLAFAALQRADRVRRQPRDGREFFLREPRRLAERLELRTERSGTATGLHGGLIVSPASVRPSYERCAMAVSGRYRRSLPNCLTTALESSLFGLNGLHR